MMIQLANEFHYRDHSTELVLVHTSGPHKSLINTSIPTKEIGGENALTIQYNLWQHLRGRDTDVLLSTMEIPNIVSVLATRWPNSVPVVLRIANVNSKKERQGKYRAIPVLKRLIYPFAEAIITISDGVARDLADVTNIPTQRTTTIYNPAYDPEIPLKANKTIQHEWLTDDTKQVAIGVGNMKPQKGFVTLIQAIHEVNKEDDLYLVILGKGDLKNHLEEVAEDLDVRDRVSFPGFVDNPYAYMSRADVFVLSSAWEGFGNVIVEAMACGTPVVCTDCPGGPAEILDEGKYGPLVPVGDGKTMAETMQRILKNPTDSDILINRAQEFAIKKIVDEYENVLRSVANRN